MQVKLFNIPVKYRSCARTMYLEFLYT